MLPAGQLRTGRRGAFFCLLFGKMISVRFSGTGFSAAFRTHGKTHGNLQKQADEAVRMKNLPFYRVKML